MAKAEVKLIIKSSWYVMPLLVIGAIIPCLDKPTFWLAKLGVKAELA